MERSLRSEMALTLWLGEAGLALGKVMGGMCRSGSVCRLGGWVSCGGEAGSSRLGWNRRDFLELDWMSMPNLRPVTQRCSSRSLPKRRSRLRGWVWV